MQSLEPRKRHHDQHQSQQQDQWRGSQEQASSFRRGAVDSDTLMSLVADFYICLLVTVLLQLILP